MTHNVTIKLYKNYKIDIFDFWMTRSNWSTVDGENQILARNLSQK